MLLLRPRVRFFALLRMTKRRGFFDYAYGYAQNDKDPPLGTMVKHVAS